MKRSYSNAVGNVFYQKIGKLFFAVAMADGAIHVKEIDRLKDIVRDKWLPLDDIEDEYGTDSAFQIEIVFNWLLEYEKNSSECYNEFEDFYKDNPKIFTPNVKSLIFDTSYAIANAFSGKNKSELVVLGKLQLLFRNKSQKK